MYETALGEDGAVLRPLEPWRAEEFLAHLDRGREFIGRHVGLPDIVPDLPAARRFLRNYAERAAADTGCVHGIWSEERLVGGVLLRTMDIPQGTAEAGCWLEPAATGRGLVTRAARVLIDWAIEGRGIHRVEWQVAPANAPSIAVARRLGMTREGVLRENYLYRGRRLDTEIWSVLAPDWRANRSAESNGSGDGPSSRLKADRELRQRGQQEDGADLDPQVLGAHDLAGSPE